MCVSDALEAVIALLYNGRADVHTRQFAGILVADWTHAVRIAIERAERTTPR